MYIIIRGIVEPYNHTISMQKKMLTFVSMFAYLNYYHQMVTTIALINSMTNSIITW